MNATEPVPFIIRRQGEAAPAPETLDVVAATLWREVLSSRRITSAAELTILEHACQCHSRAEALRRLIAIEGELLVTDRGGTKANPLLMVEVQCRALCARLLDKLIPAEDRRGPGRPAGQRPSY